MMSFFFTNVKKEKKGIKSIKNIHLAKQGCKVCPLAKSKNKHKNIKPSGSREALLYVIGSFPGVSEDSFGSQFIDRGGQLLRKTLDIVFGKQNVLDIIRYNTCIRCRPTKGIEDRVPTQFELTCCKQDLVKDIELVKPLIIIGVGKLPLKNLVNTSDINVWRGRKIPIKVGSHTCWYFPILSPETVLKRRKQNFESEYDKIFKQDLESIKSFLYEENYTEAIIEQESYEEGIEIISNEDQKNTEKIKNIFTELKSYSSVALDIETTGFNPSDSEARILSIAIGTEEKTYSLLIDHPTLSSDMISRNHKLLKDFLLSSGVKAAHNLKFELIWFEWFYGKDILFKTEWADTMAQAYIFDERHGGAKDEGVLSLNGLCLLYYGFKLKELTKGLSKDKLINEDVQTLLRYNGLDTKYTYKVYHTQNELMPAKLRPVYEHLIDTAKTLAATQNKGLLVDLDKIEFFKDKYNTMISKYTSDIKELEEVKTFEDKHGTFNFASNKHLSIIFRDILGLKRVKKTAGGEYSTDAEVLKKWEEDKVVLAELILKWRGVSKLKKLYIDGVLSEISEDLNLYPNYNHLATSTGRTSSSKAN